MAERHALIAETREGETHSHDGIDAPSNPTRRAILEQLVRGPLTVGDLASRVPVSRPAVSQHLKVLKDARLVNDHQSGSRRIYQISSDGIARMRAYLDSFWERTLENLKTAAEQPRKGKQ